MPLNVYDNRGNKIGEARDDSLGTAVGLAILWKALPVLIVLALLTVGIQEGGRLLARIRTAFLAPKVHIQNLVVGSLDAGFPVAYEMVSTDGKTRQVTAVIELAVTYQGCGWAGEPPPEDGGSPIEITYTGAAYCTCMPNEPCYGRTDPLGWDDIRRYNDNPSRVMARCRSYDVGIPVARIVEVK